MSVIDKIAVDFPRTFDKPGIFLAVEPKMQRADKDNPNSPQVQGRDSNGGLKWTATVAVAVKSFDREKYENLSITLTSPTQPCSNIAPGSSVLVDGLVQGLMTGNKNPQFWSADGIRPVTAQAAAREPARVAVGQ